MTDNNGKSAVVVDTQPMSLEERITAIVFQGLVNRGGARVFRKAKFWNWPAADEFWMDYLSARKGFSFDDAPTLPELVAEFHGAVKGLVVWDPKIIQSRWAAANIAGLNDLLPVAPECIERYTGLPVVEDLRGGFASEMDCARWSAATLLPQCDPVMGFSIENTWSGCTIDSLDFAVQNKIFIYCLHHGGDKREEIELMHAILSKIGPCAPIFGWGEPEEDYCAAISAHDNYVMCAEAPNLSFWKHVPCERTSWIQPARKHPSAFKLENKHYVALCTSEGDTPKMAVSVQGGAWADLNRGKIAVNWGMNPLHLKWFPAVLEFYWDNATENDYFMGGASGAGYTYPNRMPNPEAWMRQTGEYFRKADMHETDAWMHFSRPVYELYAKVSGIKAFTMPCGPYGATLINDETVTFLRGNSGLNYFENSAAPVELAQQLKRNAWMRGTPSFSVAHLVPDSRQSPESQSGWNPTLFLEMREFLGEEFNIVTIQELAELAIIAIKEGRLVDCQSPEYSEWDDVRKP